MSNVKSALGPVTCALLVGLLVAGCGDSKPVAQKVTGKDKLEEFGHMLKNLANDKIPPPASAAELGNVDALIPNTVEDLKSGEIVYVWGSKLSGGSAVVAYEKKAATDGGYVLLQDGTVKQMSAAEFQAAPKAKK